MAVISPRLCRGFPRLWVKPQARINANSGAAVVRLVLVQLTPQDVLPWPTAVKPVGSTHLESLSNPGAQALANAAPSPARKLTTNAFLQDRRRCRSRRKLSRVLRPCHHEPRVHPSQAQLSLQEIQVRSRKSTAGPRSLAFSGNSFLCWVLGDPGNLGSIYIARSPAGRRFGGSGIAVAKFIPAVRMGKGIHVAETSQRVPSSRELGNGSNLLQP